VKERKEMKQLLGILGLIRDLEIPTYFSREDRHDMKYWLVMAMVTSEIFIPFFKIHTDANPPLFIDSRQVTIQKNYKENCVGKQEKYKTTTIFSHPIYK
jgi:hypothetical protein